MTYLILAQQKILGLPFFRFPSVRYFTIREIMRTRSFSAVLLALVAISVLVYAAALYMTFDLGFQIRSNSAELRKAEVALEEKEIEAQIALSSLASEHKNVLESMQKISVMQFITPSSFVASQFSAQIP
ncbi:MAG: hypothetical protein HYT98_00850 [Candidatus Sungbacteria bacterium]|nr:hypothetical protein [Candidatus Sungbacteria bacterium]